MLDADGLNAHAEEGGLEQLAKREAPTVLTPHAGELGRLLELPSAEIDAQRLEHVLRRCRARAGDRRAQGRRHAGCRARRPRRDQPGGAPALATAGTGDVLAGVTGAFLAKGIEPFTAACAAVSTHVLAGAIAARGGRVEGVIASDVIAALPRARAESGRGASAEEAEMALRAVAEVNLAAIERNTARLRERIGPRTRAVRRRQG